MINTYLYRYEDFCIEGLLHPIRILLLEYRTISETPKGVWISIDDSDVKRFVLKKSRKKFACSTVEEALISFIARKKQQIRVIKNQLERAESALFSAQEMKKGRDKFFKILDIVLNDNQLNRTDAKLEEEWTEEELQLFYEQAKLIPDERMEDFAIGEETIARKITFKYKVQGLHNFLNSLV